MSNINNASTGGISFLGALTILFIGLKLGGVINWSWLWVLSPLWLGLVAIISIIAVIALPIVIGVCLWLWLYCKVKGKK